MNDVKDLALAIKDRISRHNAPIFAGGVAFFAFLALIPALPGIIGIYGLVSDPNDVTDQLSEALEGAPETTRDFLVEQMSSIAGGSGGALGLSVAISIGLALFSASGAVANLIKSLNVAYELDETRKPWILRGLAIGLMLGGIVLLLVVTFLMAALPPLLSNVGLGGVASLALNTLRFPILGAVMAIGLSVLYRLGPDHRGNDKPLAPTLITVGGLVATVLFVVLSGLFSFYTANLGSYGETYGPLATIVVLLLWFQLSALAIIVGAEVDAERSDREWKARTGLEADAARAHNGVGAIEAMLGAYSARDTDAVLATWHRRGVERHPLFGEVAVPDQLRSELDALFGALPDLTIELDDANGTGHAATARYRMTGTFSGEPWHGVVANGRTVDLDVVSLVQLEEGFVVQHELVFDTGALTRQLGFRPGDQSRSARGRAAFGRLRRRVQDRRSAADDSAADDIEPAA
ncbi:MAG: YhjD/YihY/BrkB family envelope integrity protein [Actinomycetota bacterium]